MNETIINNKKIGFDYEIIKKYEAGIQLIGSEVKSVKKHNISINEAYVSIKNGEAFLKQCFINKFESSNNFIKLEETRDRKLLLNKKEILDLHEQVTKLGYTIVPKEVINKNGLIKIIICLVKGKNNYNKKQVIKERDIKRDTERTYSLKF